MRSFHDPSFGLVAWLASFGVAFFLALLDVGAIVLCRHGLFCAFAFVTRVGAQMLGFELARFRTVNNHGVQCHFQQFHIMGVGSADDERQRDSTRVYEKAAFAPIFSPDPWGWVQRIPALKVPCP